MTTKYFFNWTDTDFSQMYNSESWDFKAGSHMLLKEFLADFFVLKSDSITFLYALSNFDIFSSA